MSFFAKSSNDSSSNKPKMHRLFLHSSANSNTVFEVAMRYTWPSPRIFVWKFEQAPTTKVLGLKGEENVGSFLHSWQDV